MWPHVLLLGVALAPNGAGVAAQAELIAKVELLKLLGPALGRPHADTLNGSKHANMKELRAIRRTRS